MLRLKSPSWTGYQINACVSNANQWRFCGDCPIIVDAATMAASPGGRWVIRYPKDAWVNRWMEEREGKRRNDKAVSTVSAGAAGAVATKVFQRGKGIAASWKGFQRENLALQFSNRGRIRLTKDALPHPQRPPAHPRPPPKPTPRSPQPPCLYSRQ